MRRFDKTYIVKTKDLSRELGRYTTVAGAKAAMKRRGIAKGEYRLFQIKF